MRIRPIAVVVLVAIATAIGVEAQRVRSYEYSGSETCLWGARGQQREVLMSYWGLFGRISVRAPDVPAYSWVVLSDSGKPIAGGSATTAREALNDLCGQLIRIIGTGGARVDLRPEDAYRQLLEALESRR